MSWYGRFWVPPARKAPIFRRRGRSTRGIRVQSRFVTRKRPCPLPVIAEVSKFNPVDARLDASSNLRGLASDPFVKVVRAIFCYVVDYLNHATIVAN